MPGIVRPLIGPLAEKKFYKLFPGYGRNDDFEASGERRAACGCRAGRTTPSSINRYLIGRVAPSLPENSPANTLTGTGTGASNFEALTYDGTNTPHFYVAVESEAHNGAYYPRIRQYDGALTYQSADWTDLAFSSATNNKSLEGIAYVRRAGADYLLGLIEGTGAIKVLKQTSNGWLTQATLYLPSGVFFADYADIAVSGTRVAVCSQEESRVWVGQLSPAAWRFEGNGQVYSLPTGSTAGVAGAGPYPIYGNVEDVSWLDDSTLVCVSDRAASTQPSYQAYKDQSIHLFRVR